MLESSSTNTATPALHVLRTTSPFPFTEGQIMSALEVEFWTDPMHKRLHRCKYVGADKMYRFHVVRLENGEYWTIHAHQIVALHLTEPDKTISPCGEGVTTSPSSKVEKPK